MEKNGLLGEKKRKEWLCLHIYLPIDEERHVGIPPSSSLLHSSLGC